MPTSPSVPLILDSVTHLSAEHHGAVAYCGSHAGIYAAYYAAYKGLAAVILNDAGIGRERAGVAGLALLEKLGVPGGAISHLSARIGEGQDGVARGVLTTINGPARNLGLDVGMACKDALALLMRAAPKPSPAPEPLEESRVDPKTGRFVAKGFGGYHVPANADVTKLPHGVQSDCSVALFGPADAGGNAVASLVARTR